MIEQYNLQIWDQDGKVYVYCPCPYNGRDHDRRLRSWFTQSGLPTHNVVVSRTPPPSSIHEDNVRHGVYLTGDTPIDEIQTKAEKNQKEPSKTLDVTNVKSSMVLSIKDCHLLNGAMQEHMLKDWRNK